MYQIIPCSNYNDFLHIENEIRNAHFLSANKTGHAGILYRGQGNFKWDLEASLFRKSLNQRPNIASYLRNLWNNTRLSNRNIKRPSRNDNEFNSKIRKVINRAGSACWPLDKDIMELMISARHSGWKSPLLDWTYCKFIASYFAFSSSVDAKMPVSIFMKTTSNYAPSEGFMDGSSSIIHETDSSYSTIQRDEVQRSRYSVSYMISEKATSYTFINAKKPEEIIEHSSLKTAIYKFIIPSYNKNQILNFLNLNYSINKNSLMPTDSSFRIAHD